MQQRERNTSLPGDFHSLFTLPHVSPSAEIFEGYVNISGG